MVAYIWVLVVYTIWTPNRVSMIEAFITFALFPGFVGLSYAADQNFFIKRSAKEQADVESKLADGRARAAPAGIARPGEYLRHHGADPSGSLRHASGIGSRSGSRNRDKRLIVKLL